MKALFVHDHVFLRYNNKYYSRGKLTYKTLSYYLKYCDDLTVIGRVKDTVIDPGIKFISEGPQITILGLNSPISKSGIQDRKKLKKSIINEVNNCDYLLVRLPSELGLLANTLAKQNSKPVLNEMVASPFDCLWFRGDLFAKCYAPFLSWRVKKALKNSKNTIYVTDFYLQKNYPSDGNSIGISDARVSVVKKLKTEKNINNKKIKIGTIANPALALKGVNVLFEAIKCLPKEKFELSIVGGENNSTLEKNMMSHSNINQLGYIAEKHELEAWFCTLDLYVQPSYTEGLPRSIIEAMSFGIPTLGSCVGGIPELVHSEGLFKAGSSEELSELLTTVYKSSNFRKKLANHSYEKVSQFGEELDRKKRKFIEDFIKSEVGSYKEVEVL